MTTFKANKWNSPEVQQLYKMLPQRQALELEQRSNIAEYNKGCYTLIGHTSKKVPNSATFTHELVYYTKTIPDYDQMNRRWQNTRGEFDTRIILHDPKLDMFKPVQGASPKKKEIEALSEQQIQQVQIMSADGDSLKDIAEQLGVTQKRIKPYLK